MILIRPFQEEGTQVAILMSIVTIAFVLLATLSESKMQRRTPFCLAVACISVLPCLHHNNFGNETGIWLHYAICLHVLSVGNLYRMCWT